MTLERRSPLPKGRYWADMFARDGDDQVQAMTDWLTQNRGLVKLVSSETFSDSDPPRTWFLFEVVGGPDGSGGTLLPEWVGIGFPTVAGPDIRSSDDTVQKPAAGGAPLWAWGLVFLGAGLLAFTVRDLVKGVVGK